MLSIVLAASGFILSLLLTPLVRDLALRLGWVDQPDHRRKTHAGPVPRIGGVPIVIAYAGSFGVLLLTSLPGALPLRQSLPLVVKLLPAAALVFATGLLDDLAGLRPSQKLLGETLAAALACWGGIRIDTLAGLPIDGLLAVPLTILWLVGCANAFNLIDGMDGLASGVGLLASFAMLAAGFAHRDAGLLAVVAPLAGAMLGFLVFNFNPASIFLGDCGSLWVGFMLACCGVVWSQRSPTLPGTTAPLMALSIPLLDTTLTIARRFLRRQPILRADRGHIHHRLLDRGLTPRRTVLLLYAASGTAACFAILQVEAGSDLSGLLLALFCLAVWIGIKLLGYQEFSVAALLLRQNSLRSMVESHLSLRDHEGSLRDAGTVEECWRAIQTVGREFGFSHVALRLGGRSYQEHLDPAANGHWTLHIPLSDSEYVRLMCQFEWSKTPAIIAPIADLLHRALSMKVAQLSSGPATASKSAMAAAASVSPPPGRSDYIRRVA